MTQQKIVDGSKYLAEIEALKGLYEHLHTYHWERSVGHNHVVSQLSLLGIDHGKPNATELQTHIAKGNRQLFWEIRELINKRIEALQLEFKEL